MAMSCQASCTLQWVHPRRRLGPPATNTNRQSIIPHELSMPEGPDAWSVMLRAVSFVLLLNSAGIPIFIAMFGHLIPDSLPAITRLGWRMAVGALVVVAGHHALEAARMTGDVSGLTDPAMQAMTLRSSEGAAFALRMVGLGLVAVGLRH